MVFIYFPQTFKLLILHNISILNQLKVCALIQKKNYGARYFVAQAGSIISPVLYTAVVGNNYGVRIFQNGKEILGGEID